MKNTVYYLNRFEELMDILRTEKLMTLTKNVNDHYKQIEIPKRNGQLRTIMVPDEELKDIQKRIGELFERALYIKDCKKAYTPYYDWTNHQQTYHPYKNGASSFGFEKNKSIVMNAEVHRYGSYFFKADISQFFSSINYHAVKSMLRKVISINCRSFYSLYGNTSRVKNLNNELSDLNATWKYKAIANLLCNNGGLATGSPASPVISNFFMRSFDKQMETYLTRLRLDSKNETLFRYTRYADDITISSNKRIPESMKDFVSQKLKAKKHLTLNESKTHFQSAKAKNIITGINVTSKGKITVGNHKKVIIKKMLYNLTCHKIQDFKKDKQVTLGNVAYMYSVEPIYTRKMIEKYKAIATANEAQLRLYNHGPEILTFFQTLDDTFKKKPTFA